MEKLALLPFARQTIEPEDVQAADQDTVLLALRAENIGVTLHYPLVYRHAFYRERLGCGPGLCPVAESVEGRLVTLPLFPAMTDEDQDDVLHALDKVFAHYAR
jgi:perosamine synthetase